MLVILGILIVAATVYLLIKQYDTKLVLFTAGVLMALIGGNPIAALNAFATRMGTAGLIMPICSVMGFAYVMKESKCDQHLVNLLANFLKKFRMILIPGAAIGTFAINIALPSAAGTSAAVGAIFIPLLIAAGISPAIAASAVLSGTFGSMLNPGLSHNPFIAELADVGVTDVIASHSPATIMAVIIGAISITIVAKVLKEDKGYVVKDNDGASLQAEGEAMKVNFLYAIVPIVPVALLVLGSTILPSIELGIPQAMLIGIILAVIVTRMNPETISKSFFNGMGSAYGQIMGVVICAAVFVSGMETIGIVEAFINTLINSESVVKIAATFGPFLLGIISGSGDAATFAFNEAVTPHATMFGLEILNMGSVAALAGALGRTMSPIAGGTIICASIAGVSPMELAKRNAPGMIIGVIVAMFVLL